MCNFDYRFLQSTCQDFQRAVYFCGKSDRLAKVLQFSSGAQKNRALKRMRRADHQGPPTNQLDLFQQNAGKVKDIKAGVNPFLHALELHEQQAHLAEVEYRRAIEMGLNTADAFCNLGTILAERGEIPQAIAHFSRALAEHPTHLYGHYNLANIYLDAGNLALARLHYQVALEIGPPFPELYLNLGLLFLIHGDKPRALEMLSNYEESTPEAQEEIHRLLLEHGLDAL